MGSFIPVTSFATDNAAGVQPESYADRVVPRHQSQGTTWTELRGGQSQTTTAGTTTAPVTTATTNMGVAAKAAAETKTEADDLTMRALRASSARVRVVDA